MTSEKQEQQEQLLSDSSIVDAENSNATDAAAAAEEETKPNVFKIHSDKINLDLTVHVQDDTLSTSKCYVMTVHDLGCDHSTFVEFIGVPEMRGLRERIVWLHVVLPGQESQAADLNIEKYPTLIELGDALVDVVDFFKLARVTCFGEGAGANVCARFAMQHPNRSLGIILINPSGSAAGFFETMADKLNNWRLMKQGMNAKAEAYLVWHRFGSSAGDNNLVQANIKEFHKKLYENRNSKNLALYIDAFLNRSNITEKLDNLKVDVLTAVGRRSSISSETKKFYKALCDSRRSELQNLVNSPILEVEEVGDIMGETPDRLATSLQFFLQGMGLVPALPMKKTLQGLGRMSRAYSMEEADRPTRKNSILEVSHLAAN